MKKTIVLLFIFIFGTAFLYATPESLFIGEWEGSISGYDFNIVFMHSNMCIITVKTIQDGKQIADETTGTWFCDNDYDIITINGSFPKSKIKGLSQISWSAVYSFSNSDRSSFVMRVTLPGVDRQRMSFIRINKWE